MGKKTMAMGHFQMGLKKLNARHIGLPDMRQGKQMAIDWVVTLQEQGEFVNQIAEDVIETLANPNLTTTQATKLYQSVERGAQTFDRIMDELEQHEIDRNLLDAAEAIADMWINLSVAAANRLRIIEGKPPIGFSSE